MGTGRLDFVWDYDVSEQEFRSLLAGGPPLGRLDGDWAAVRLLEYAPYDRIRAFLGIGPSFWILDSGCRLLAPET